MTFNTFSAAEGHMPNQFTMV